MFVLQAIIFGCRFPFHSCCRSDKPEFSGLKAEHCSAFDRCELTLSFQWRTLRAGTEAPGSVDCGRDFQSSAIQGLKMGFVSAAFGKPVSASRD
jgi:hypothetical protein